MLFVCEEHYFNILLFCVLYLPQIVPLFITSCVAGGLECCAASFSSGVSVYIVRGYQPTAKVRTGPNDNIRPMAFLNLYCLRMKPLCIEPCA